MSRKLSVSVISMDWSAYAHAKATASSREITCPVELATSFSFKTTTRPNMMMQGPMRNVSKVMLPATILKARSHS